uniref:Uncharacterized protein n=1 Tax=Ananas comosus var. bracteatus TaxID=296719 RepID=A0A6V7P4V8_ANACO|nr:unnamed protein product [Ananas comosus var. bracteatus]
MCFGFSCSGTGLSLEGPVPESLSCGLRLSANFYAYGDRSSPPGTGPREQNSQDLAKFSFSSLAARTGTGLSQQGPVPESNTCAQRFSAAHHAYGNGPPYQGPVSESKNLPSAYLHYLLSWTTTLMHFLGFRHLRLFQSLPTRKLVDSERSPTLRFREFISLH